MPDSSVNTKTFKRILTFNITLPLAMSALLCGVFVLLLFGLLGQSREVARSDHSIAQANEAVKLIIDSETGLRGYLLAGKDIFLQPYREASIALPHTLNEVRSLVGDAPEQLTRLDSAERRLGAWQHTAQLAIDARRAAGKTVVADMEERKRDMDALRNDFRNLLNAAEYRRDERVAKTTQTTHVVIALSVLLCLITGGIIAIVGRRQLMALSESYEKVLQTQADQNNQLMQQAWVRKGQTDLATRVAGDLAENELSRYILEFVADYLGATVGALYALRTAGEPVLELTAGYGVTEKDSGLPTTFRMGEGVVGQSAATRRLTRLDDLPADFPRIRSATGMTAPRQAFIVPLSVDGAVQGVLELGFLKPLEEGKVDFLIEVAELIGNAQRSLAYRRRLQDLLHESQQLAEELQTQQEELRVSNEELSERGKALQDAQARLESQHAELEQTNEQLEEQAQVLEQQKQYVDERNHELQLARHAIETKARELEAASKYKSEFLANMSHELRTPLNSSLILAKLLKDNPDENLTAEQVEFASTIYAAGNDLLTLINDILDLSKVEAGKLETHAETVSLESVVKNMERVFQPIANDRKLSLSLNLMPGLPPSLVTDRQRLEQILKNLLSNALKFTHHGSVRLTIAPTAETSGFVDFRVSDTGVGIDPSQQSVVFEAFRQADGTTNRKYGGTGLGLSISKNLAELLGGAIRLESEPGKGSSFTLVLPPVLPSPAAATSSEASIGFVENVFAADRPGANASAPRAGAPAKLTEASLPVDSSVQPPFDDDRALIVGSEGVRSLLIVEDDPQFARVLFDLAHERKFKALVAMTTQEGYALAVRYLPGAIILDMKLPDASGLSLLDRIKQNPATRHIPVHAISASDLAREALHLGAVGYIVKPATPESLRDTFAKLEERISQNIRRVLVVEDDDVQRDAIGRLIGDKGVEIVSVAQGQDALTRLRETTFDCMIMDLTLPDMSGFDLLQAMSDTGDMAFPPVIVYTGRSLSRAEEERLGRYSRTIIIKGARSPERLLDEVTLFLHQVESKLSPERQKILHDSRNREKAFDGRRILLVDDDVRNIFALTSALEHKGAAIRVARNGREALDRLAQEPDLDLVLMDVMMPEMDGYEAMTEIRKQSRFASLPIIAVTAKAMRDDYERCLQCGANDYLAKPVDTDKLVSLMRVWLPKQIGRA